MPGMESRSPRAIMSDQSVFGSIWVVETGYLAGFGVPWSTRARLLFARRLEKDVSGKILRLSGSLSCHDPLPCNETTRLFL